MKVFRVCLFILVAAAAHSQTTSAPADAAQSHPSVADFGLLYPLSNDWVLATEMLRSKVESSSPTPDFDVLLASVYVPKADISGANPFFSLYAYRQPATDCRKSLEAALAHSQDKKKQPEGRVEEFSVAGRDYFRVNLVRGAGGRYQSIICTTAKSHLLVWNASASQEKGVDAIVATLNLIAPSHTRSATESAQSTEPKDAATEETSSKPDLSGVTKVRVSSGVTTGMLVKKVNPSYPANARAAYIQGTVVLRAEISKTGDITHLELVSGPIELAGSAVAAVRQWKYKPYLLKGEPVIVDTQIQVNYELRP
jgi:TonB family protein